MYDRRFARPLLVVDFDRIVADGYDEIGAIRESLEIAPARPPDNSGPVRMTFRKKTLRVHGRRKRQPLALDKRK